MGEVAKVARQQVPVGGVPGSAPLRVEEARKSLGDLLDEVVERGGVRLIAKRREDPVALVAISRVEEAKLTAAPVHSYTNTRRGLGELVSAAAQGAPQVIARSGYPVAALVPTTMVHVRNITSLGEAVDCLGATGRVAHLTTGLRSLDAATGGLAVGKAVVVAARPGAGGGPLVATAARAAALHAGLTVLYAASGPSRDDVSARIVAAEAGVDYRRMRAGALDPSDEAAARATRTRIRQKAPLHIDHGSGLSAEAIASTARAIPGLALIVVDRLQHAHNPHLPLSGPAVADATAVLAHIARELHVPVLAAYDTIDPQALHQLTADDIWILNPDGTVTITERDLGTVGTIRLRPDLTRARFLDPDPTPPPTPEAPTTVPGPIPETDPAAHPTSPADPPATPSATAAGDTAPPSPPAAPSTRQQTSPSAAPATIRPTTRRQQGADRLDLKTFVTARVTAALQRHEDDVEAARRALAAEGGSAIPDVMNLFEATRVGTAYQHTTYPKLPEPLVRKRRDQADDVWEGRPKFYNHAVPDGTPVTELDINAAYLAALQSAHLPIRTITHNPEGWDDLDNYGKGIDLAGICRIDPVEWDHPDLPHPLGDDREETGRLWVPTSVLLGLRDMASPGYGELCKPPKIREAYVAKGSAALFKTLVSVLDTARMEAIEKNDDLTKSYVAAMYAKLVSTMGDSRNNHQLRRPDWMHIIRGQAFANARRKAIRAQKAGLTVVHVGGTDELHLAGDVWAAVHNGRPVFTEGRALNQIKIKNQRPKGER